MPARGALGTLLLITEALTCRFDFSLILISVLHDLLLGHAEKRLGACIIGYGLQMGRIAVEVFKGIRV